MTQRVVPYCEPGENLRSNPVRWAASLQNQAHFAATEIARFASPGDPRHPEAKCFRGVFGPNHRGVLAVWYQTMRVNQAWTTRNRNWRESLKGPWMR